MCLAYYCSYLEVGHELILVGHLNGCQSVCAGPGHAVILLSIVGVLTRYGGGILTKKKQLMFIFLKYIPSIYVCTYERFMWKQLLR